MTNRSTTQFFPPRMLESLNEARVMEADVSFPGAKSFSYVHGELQLRNTESPSSSKGVDDKAHSVRL